MSSCGLCGWDCIPGATHNAGTCKLLTVQCASEIVNGHSLFLRPMACSCKGEVCKGKCSLCLEVGHLPLTVKYEEAYRMVRMRLLSGAFFTS